MMFDCISIDLINKILDFKYSYDHYISFKTLLKEIKIKSIIYNLEYIRKNNYDPFSDDLYDIYLNIFDENDLINIINTLNTCRCCKRHQLNRPSLEDYLNGIVPEYSKSYSNSTLCQCSCRHHIRHICRAKNDEIL